MIRINFYLSRYDCVIEKSRPVITASISGDDVQSLKNLLKMAEDSDLYVPAHEKVSLIAKIESLQPCLLQEQFNIF